VCRAACPATIIIKPLEFTAKPQRPQRGAEEDLFFLIFRQNPRDFLIRIIPALRPFATFAPSRFNSSIHVTRRSKAPSLHS
jgi:hypothetical protein